MGQTNAIILLLAIAVAVAVTSWAVIRMGSAVPPALSSPAAKSSFGGPLCAFVAGQSFWFLSCLAQSCYLAAELWFLLERTPGAVANAAVAAMPMIAVLVMSGLVLYIAAFKRTTAAPAAVVVMLCLMGPGSSMLKTLCFNLPLDPAVDTVRFGWVVAWSAYFAISPRIALLYGTPRGRQIRESGRAWEALPGQRLLKR